MANSRILLLGTGALCLLLCACGGGGGVSSASGTPSAPHVTVSLSPVSGGAVIAGHSGTITAAVTGNTNQAVTWSVNGVTGGNGTVGTITTSGVYSAPASPPAGGTVTIEATAATDTTASASMIVTVIPPPDIAWASGAPQAATLNNPVTIPATVTGATQCTYSLSQVPAAGAINTVAPTLTPADSSRTCAGVVFDPGSTMPVGATSYQITVTPVIANLLPGDTDPLPVSTTTVSLLAPAPVLASTSPVAVPSNGTIVLSLKSANPTFTSANSTGSGADFAGTEASVNCFGDFDGLFGRTLFVSPTEVQLNLTVTSATVGAQCRVNVKNPGPGGGTGTPIYIPVVASSSNVVATASTNPHSSPLVATFDEHNHVVHLTSGTPTQDVPAPASTAAIAARNGTVLVGGDQSLSVISQGTVQTIPEPGIRFVAAAGAYSSLYAFGADGQVVRVDGTDASLLRMMGPITAAAGDGQHLAVLSLGQLYLLGKDGSLLASMPVPGATEVAVLPAAVVLGTFGKSSLTQIDLGTLVSSPIDLPAPLQTLQAIHGQLWCSLLGGTIFRADRGPVTHLSPDDLRDGFAVVPGHLITYNHVYERTRTDAAAH